MINLDPVSFNEIIHILFLVSLIFNYATINLNIVYSLCNALDRNQSIISTPYNLILEKGGGDKRSAPHSQWLRLYVMFFFYICKIQMWHSAEK